MTHYTPLTNIDEKLDIIEHVNQDHTEEVAVIVQDYLSTKKQSGWEVVSAQIEDIFKEGMTVLVATKSHGKQVVSVDFELEGELEEQIFYLAYMAMFKQGKDFSGNSKHYFEVIDKQQITTNITRLTLKSQTPLPSEYAGYAYGMVLKVLNKRPKAEATKPKKHGLLKKIGNQAFLWGLKKMSSKNRQKMVDGMNKNVRLYTLRAAWKTDDSEVLNTGYMDVFTHVPATSGKHKESAGSQWCASLAVGDVVFSRAQAPDKHDYLNSGQHVLIADETAFPAIAGLLDLWKNPRPPQVIVVSTDQAEQAYFDASWMPEGMILHRIVADVANQSERIIQVLETLPLIDGAWAGLENQTAKAVRHYLRNQHQLTGKTNHVKAYWRMK